jgi:hypothetical protein
VGHASGSTTRKIGDGRQRPRLIGEIQTIFFSEILRAAALVARQTLAKQKHR